MTAYSQKILTRRRLATLLVVMVLLSLVAGTLFGDSGILVGMQVNREYERLLEERDRLMEDNARLKEEIRALRSGSRRIEEIGRTEFGFGRPGEVIYYFPNNPRAAIQKMDHREPDQKSDR